MGNYKLFSTQSRLLTTLRKKCFENIEGKGENAGTQHFHIFSRVPLCPTQISVLGHIYHVVCRCFQSQLLMTQRKKCFKKIEGKGENAGTGIFTFSHNVFLSDLCRFQFWVTFIMLSAVAFNLDWSKTLLCGKELTLYQTIKFQTDPN